MKDDLMTFDELIQKVTHYNTKTAKTTEDYFKTNKEGNFYSDIDLNYILKERPYQCETCGFFDFSKREICPACGKKRSEHPSHFYRDPIEFSEKFKQVEEEVNKKARKESGALLGELGACHIIWSYQRNLLKKEYKILWRPMSMMNPHIRMD